jgi:hypothetical protein
MRTRRIEGGKAMEQDGKSLLLRQGDVLLVRVEEIPSHGAVSSERAADRHVLATGEATGHAHVIAGSGLRLVEWRRGRRWAAPEQRRFLLVEGEATLSHEEHLPLTVSVGVYEVRRQREYRPERSVWVAD